MASRGGAFHALFLTSDGKVFAIGKNHYGSLGCGDTNPHNDIVPVQLMEPVIDIFVGGDGESHSAAILEHMFGDEVHQIIWE
jgi:alpha-tubulin suppressor-like RCC1 family protein